MLLQQFSIVILRLCSNRVFWIRFIIRKKRLWLPASKKVPSLNDTNVTEELTILFSDSTLISNSTKANLDRNSSRGVKDIVRDKKGIFIALICAAVLLLTIGVVVVIWKFCCQKKRDQHQQVEIAEDIKVL